MAYNATESFTLPQELFGSLVEDMQPSDLPIGASPRNNDVFFLPGGVFTRPALKGLYASEGAGKILSVGDFRLASGDWQILTLDDAGNLYATDALTGSRTFLFQVAGQGRQSFATYGDFLFIATSGLGTNPNPWNTKQSGFDVPTYWNGQNVKRVTSDAPPPPSVALLTFSPAAVQSVGGVYLTRTSNYVKAYLGSSLPSGYSKGFWVSLADGSNNPINDPTVNISSMSRNALGIVTVVLASPYTNLAPGTQMYIQPPATAFTGVVAVTNGSSVVTWVSGSQFTQGMVGSSITLNGTLTYEVLSVNSAVSLTVSATIPLTTGNYSYSTMAQEFWTGGYQVVSVYEVINSTTFTFQSLNTAVTNTSSSGGSVYLQWSPVGGTYGNAAQITSVGVDGGGAYIEWFQLGPDETFNTTAPYVTLVGQASPGTHQFVLFYQNEDAQQTAPSTIISIEVGGNGQLFQFTNLPIGPAGTTQRIIAGTASGGDSFFYLEPATNASQDGLGPNLITGTVIPDNTSTSAVIDFSDSALLSGQEIDITGNDLFSQVRLDPCCGFFVYSGRVFAWGEINNLKNMQNLGFDAGYVSLTLPPYWDTTEGDGTGTLVAGDRFGGFYWQMPTGHNAQIQQGAYQDQFGGTILNPSTAYYVRFLARAGSAQSAGALSFTLHSPSGAVVDITADINVSSFTTDWAWYTISFITPYTIPSDLVLQLGLGGTFSGSYVDIDELELIPESQPVLDTQIRASYALNPFGYDGVTGIIAPQGMRAAMSSMGQLRGSLYLVDELDFRETTDTGSEPSSWTIKVLDQDCGSCSPFSMTASEDWLLWAGRHGIRFFNGNPETRKINQELARTWESIQWADPMSMWAATDSVQRMSYFGVKINPSDNTADLLIPVNVRLNDSTYNVPDPVHVSTYSGKILATDLGRKWTKWYRQIPCGGAISSNPYGLGVAKNFLFGGSLQRRIYYLDVLNYPPLNGDSTTEWNCTDDDWGGFSSEYLTSYFFPRDFEGNPLVGSYRHLFTALGFHVNGVGFMTVTPYMDAADCPSMSLPVFQDYWPDQGYDLSLGINVLCERMAPGFACASRAAFGLTKLAVSGREDAVFPMRGAL